MVKAVFKAVLDKPLGTMLWKNTVFLRKRTGCSVANCRASVVSVCKL